MSFPSEVVLLNVPPYKSIPQIMGILSSLGEKPIYANLFRRTATEPPVCIIQFANDDVAKEVVGRLNGKFIPDTYPPMPFKLKQGDRNSQILPGFDIWVGDLSQEVDDFLLFKFFLSFYVSIRYAKVIVDATGKNKGYGFVRIMDVNEQNHCLTYMNGATGLGYRPIRVNKALAGKPEGKTKQSRLDNSLSEIPLPEESPKNKKLEKEGKSEKKNFFKVYMRWSAMGEGITSKKSFLESTFPHSMQSKSHTHIQDYSDKKAYKNMNLQSLHRSSLLWDALESSKWLPPNSFILPRTNTPYVFNP